MRRWAFLSLLLAASMLSRGATAQAPCGPDFFAENFDAIADDAALTGAGWAIIQANGAVEAALWTVTNPGGRRNPPTANGTASGGKFVISDSDAAAGANTAGTGMSHDLVTPSFSTLAGKTVWLYASCSAQLNNGDTAVFDVDVSIDGGATFTNVFRRVSPGARVGVPPVPDNTNADGFFGQLAIDLTAVAALQADVKVRFRHYEPTDDWWVALDDIRVTCEAPPAAGNCTVLANQDFSAGLGSMTAVSLLANTGCETWCTTDKAVRYVPTTTTGRGVNRLSHPSVAPAFAIMESEGNPDPVEDEYLQTPIMNCSGFSSVILSYKSETVLANSALQEVLLSLDGGSTFPTRIFKYNEPGALDNGLFDDGEDTVYAERVFSVPQAAGQERVVMAFHYKGPGNSRFWAVDDVEVTGVAALCDPRDCGLRNFAVSYDAATNKVNGSWSLLPLDAAFRVLQGARVVAELGGSETSFVDSTPPAGGSGVKYTLECYVAPQVKDRDCVSSEVTTFACPQNLATRVDQVGKSVSLSWVAGINLDGTNYALSRDGTVIASPGLGVSSFTDTPPLPASGFGVYYYSLAVVGGSGGCGALEARAIVSAGAVCFADDFEDYANNIDFELGGYFLIDDGPGPGEPGGTWTTTNPGGRSNPPTFDGRASTGRFAISDSDFADGDNGAPGNGNSNDIWSPSFTCPAGKPAWLHMDTSAQLNNNGEVVFDVDVSSDGGVNWTNVYRRVAPARTKAAPVVDTTNADGFFGRLDIDLTALVAGKPAALFRLRSFEPSDDWWIAVDNIIIDDQPPPTAGNVSLFEEDFSAGLGAMSAVSLVGNSGTETWTTEDKCELTPPARSIVTAGGVFPLRDGRGVHRLAPPYAILESECDPDPVEDEYLLTPSLDCSLVTEVFLHYLSEICAVDGAVQEVLLSLDGGTTYLAQPIFSYNGGGLFDTAEDPFYAERGFRVPQAAGESRVVFAFHYKSGGNQRFWAIDDVRVTGTSICRTPFVVSIDGAASANSDTSETYSATTDATGPTTFLWEVVSGTASIQGSASDNLASVSLGAAGEVVLRVTVTDRCGAQRSATKTITVTPAGGRQKPNDENQDGKMDLSDAVAVLNYLFTGTNPSLACADGAKEHAANIALLDSNGDGKIDLSDPVRLLGFLFLGNARPANCLDDSCPCILIPDCSDSPGCP